jgi:hypothetical protein
MCVCGHNKHHKEFFIVSMRRITTLLPIHHTLPYDIEATVFFFNTNTITTTTTKQTDRQTDRQLENNGNVSSYFLNSNWDNHHCNVLIDILTNWTKRMKLRMFYN